MFSALFLTQSSVAFFWSEDISAAWGHSGWRSVSLFKVHRGESFGSATGVSEDAGSHCFQRWRSSRRSEALRGEFTTVMAGSPLPWLQIRRQRSSDALSQHCLLRLQLTLLTGLSCPAVRQKFQSNMQLYSEIYLFFSPLQVAAETLQRSETPSDQPVTFGCLSSVAP